MNLREFTGTGDLWGAIEAKHPFPFIALVGAGPLNRLTNLKYGGRQMLPVIEGLQVVDVAEYVVNEFSEKWTNLIQVSELSPLAGRKDTTTETIHNLETKTTNRSDVSKVSAYNSTDLVDNEGQSSTGDEDIDGTRNRSVTHEVTTLADAYSNLDLRTRNGIVQTALNDVASLITLSIY